MPNIPDISMTTLTAAGIVGTVAFLAFPALMLAFVFFLIRANRRTNRAVPLSRLSVWLLVTGSIGLALLAIGGFAHLPAAEWASLGLLICGLVLCGLLLRRGLGHPLQGIAWAIGADLMVLVAFLPFVIWAANLALQISAASNPNEAEVRAALARNPNDAAAHSSLGLIDGTHGDHAGEIAEFRQVLRIEPDNENALWIVGVRLTKAGRTGEARPLFQKLAAANDSYSDNAHKWLAKHGR